MNKKEVSEIKRRLRPDACAISKVYGCYVNANKEIVSTFEQPLGLMTGEENDKYMSLFKKTLSGELNRRLINVEYSTEQVVNSSSYNLLALLRSTKLSDPAARRKLYDHIIPTLSFQDNYLILLAHNVYDIPFKSRSDVMENNPDAGDEVFSYIICSICPVKKSKPALEYNRADSCFNLEELAWLVSQPELGFMFPAFNDRSTDIYGALFFTKSDENSYEEFVSQILDTKAPAPPALQKLNFESILARSLEDECSMDVARNIHSQLVTMMDAHKESKSAEPLTITREEITDILDASGVSEEHQAKFNVDFDCKFGSNMPVNPSNIINKKAYEIEFIGGKVSVDADMSHLVQVKKIDGGYHLVVRLESSDSVVVNGVNICLRE